MPTPKEIAEQIGPAEPFDALKYALETLAEWAPADAVEDCRNEIRALAAEQPRPSPAQVELETTEEERIFWINALANPLEGRLAKEATRRLIRDIDRLLALRQQEERGRD